MEEIWKDAKDYEDYFMVSNLGNVFSKRTNKILKTQTSGTGYRSFVTRFNGRNGPCKCIKVHQIVARTFIDNPYNRTIINHIDGDKTNAAVSNLEWSTHSENMLHAHNTGLIKSNFKTNQNPSLKLTREQVEYIQNYYIPRHKEFGARALGRKFNVGHTAILSVINKVRSNTYKENNT